MRITDLIQHSLTEVTGRFRTTPRMIKGAKSAKAQVFVEMPPLDFLRLTTSTDDDIRDIMAVTQPLLKYNRWAKMGNDSVYSGFVNSNPELKKRMAGPMDDVDAHPVYGDIIHPFLGIQIRQTENGYLLGQVVSHEGRHRAAAVLMKKGRWFPVALKLRPDRDLEIPGVPNYENLEYFMGKEFLPEIIRGQYDRNRFSDTSRWNITRSEPLRRAAMPRQGEAA